MVELVANRREPQHRLQRALGFGAERIVRFGKGCVKPSPTGTPEVFELITTLKSFNNWLVQQGYVVSEFVPQIAQRIAFTIKGEFARASHVVSVVALGHLVPDACKSVKEAFSITSKDPSKLASFMSSSVTSYSALKAIKNVLLVSMVAIAVFEAMPRLTSLELSPGLIRVLTYGRGFVKFPYLIATAMTHLSNLSEAYKRSYLEREVSAHCEVQLTRLEDARFVARGSAGGAAEGGSETGVRAGAERSPGGAERAAVEAVEVAVDGGALDVALPERQKAELEDALARSRQKEKRDQRSQVWSMVGLIKCGAAAVSSGVLPMDLTPSGVLIARGVAAASAIWLNFFVDEAPAYSSSQIRRAAKGAAVGEDDEEEDEEGLRDEVRADAHVEEGVRVTV